MRELSLHIMDIIENSISAKATLICLEIIEDKNSDILKIIIKDNGCGIDEKDIEKVKDPFVTSRKTRKVGLGIPLFEAACLRCEGRLDIKSAKDKGTEIEAVMKYSHIDRAPLGRIEDTIMSVLLYPQVDILYKHIVNEKEFNFDSREIKKVIGEDLTLPDILQWIKQYIKEGIDEIGGGVY
ncbi:Histidine kinase-, DNA gyrase B-, and HSP90-like ATPase [Caloramator quimbayensis]|uniref:Histidine kinase-, DNA gyrase B-, and HSP90-like ATPase n=1 Tax=Caloramator quimbayensis TaxID=1147123 RepID=A0A1T4XZ27_9CLOT|nr:ATP-binding protein [Caloramator quimbayensis]SKA94478.1 Histidine kinase-, DNA gyrase B-, and HSP90-like ATPase [Caloramator quimbayensis]